jgi:hypothetical protein
LQKWEVESGWLGGRDSNPPFFVSSWHDDISFDLPLWSMLWTPSRLSVHSAPSIWYPPQLDTKWTPRSPFALRPRGADCRPRSSTSISLPDRNTTPSTGQPANRFFAHFSHTMEIACRRCLAPLTARCLRPHLRSLIEGAPTAAAPSGTAAGGHRPAGYTDAVIIVKSRARGRDFVARDSSEARGSCDRHRPGRFDLDFGVQSNVKRVEDFHSTFKRNPEILIALIPRYLGLMNI